MSKPTTGLRRAGIASVATGALALSACVVGAGAANADADFAFERIAGENRYETAAEVYDAYGDNDSVILANGEQGHFPDALVANYLAGVEGSPILLTRSNKMPDATAARLDGGGKTITIVGGEDVVPADQAAALEAEGHTVERVAGPNRYLTAAEVIAEAGDSPSNTAIITTGVDFPDALAAGPVSVHEGSPIAISRANDIRDEEVQALVDSGVSEFIVLGGPTIVGDAVVAELEAAGLDLRDRIFGADRAETSAELANYAIDNFGLTNEGVNVASGYIAGTGADALAGGPLTGEQVRPMLITKSNRNPGDGVTAYLTEHSCTLTDGIIFGGPGAVDAASEAEMEAAAQACGGNQDFAVDQTAATNEFSAAAPDDNRGQRTYQFSGLDNSQTYDVAVFPAEYVSNTGVVTFRDTEGTAGTTDDNDVADFAATQAVIERINNAAYVDAPTNGTTATAIAPVNGVITVTLDSEAADEVRPVLYLDADNGSTETTPDLDLNAENEPTELFAVGGQKTWVAPQAEASGNADDGRVESLDKSANSVGVDTDETATVGAYDASGVDVRYVYDANDDFAIDGTPATIDEFEAALSRGDGLVVGAYSPNSSLQSEFDLVNGPTAPDAVAAEKGGAGAENDITVVVNLGQPGTDTMYDSVVIQRAPVTGAGNGDEATTGTVGTYATVATVDIADDEDANAGTVTYTDENVAVGSYRYRAAGVIDGDQGPFTADTANETSTTPSPDTTGPSAAASVVDSDTGFNDVPTTGDVFRVYFSENVTLNNPALRVADGNGDTDTIDSSNATFAAEGSVLTVTLTADLADDQTSGTNDGLSFPLTITNRSGITDAAGNGATFTDDVLEDNGPEVYSDTADSGETTFTVVFNEAVQEASAETVGNYAVTTEGTTANPVTSAVLGADGRTVTLTVTTALASGADLDTTVVDTDGQASAQTGYVLVP